MEPTEGKQETRERIAYLDYLRVLATFGVVFCSAVKPFGIWNLICDCVPA